LLALTCCIGFDNLGSNDEFLLNHQEASIVQMSAAVVCTTCYCDALLGCKSIDAVWAHLICSNYQAHLINFQELINDVSSKHGHPILFLGVSDQVGV
jgi:hypothetical protein